MSPDHYFTESVCDRLTSRPFHHHWIFPVGAPLRQAIAWPVERIVSSGGGGRSRPIGRIPTYLLVETDSGSLLAFKNERFASFSDSEVCQLVAAWRQGEEMDGWEQLDWSQFYGPMSVTQWGEGGHGNLEPLWLLRRYEAKLAASFSKIDTRLAEAFAAFTDRLDQEALRFARWPNPEFPSSPLLFDRSLYLYLSHPDPSMRRNRAQAFDLMPRPIDLLCHSQAESWFDADCLSQIDQGSSPFAALCAIEGVSRGALKHYLRHVPLLIGRKIEREELSRVLFALDCIPPNKRPMTEREWFVLVAVLESIEFWCFSHKGNRTDTGMALGRAVIRDVAMIGWSQFEPWLARHFGRNALADAKDFVDSLNSYATAAHMRGEAVVDIATIAPAGLRGLLKLSAAWHRAVDRLMTEAIIPVGNDNISQWSWPLSDPKTIGSYRIRLIKDYHKLMFEGLAMNHCVAIHATDCQSGYRRVFSLRTQKGIRRSTFDLKFNRDADGKLHIELGDHRGRKNAAPDPEWEEIVRKFTEWVVNNKYLCRLENDAEIGHQLQYTQHATAINRINVTAVAECLNEAGWVLPSDEP